MAVYIDAYGNVKPWYESPLYAGTTAVQTNLGTVMVANDIPAHLSSPLVSPQITQAIPLTNDINLAKSILEQAGRTDLNQEIKPKGLDLSGVIPLALIGMIVLLSK